MSADRRTLRLRQSKPTPSALSFWLSSPMPVPPSRRTALMRMPVLWSGPKRRAMSAFTKPWPPVCTPKPMRVSGSLGARLGSRLMAPPMPLPKGAAPLRKLLAPRKTSTRSKNSDAMYWRGSMPYRPLYATSSEYTGKPRTTYSSWKLPKPRAWRTEGSLSSTSATLRACWSWISSFV